MEKAAYTRRCDRLHTSPEVVAAREEEASSCNRSWRLLTSAALVCDNRTHTYANLWRILGSACHCSLATALSCSQHTMQNQPAAPTVKGEAWWCSGCSHSLRHRDIYQHLSDTCDMPDKSHSFDHAYRPRSRLPLIPQSARNSSIYLTARKKDTLLAQASTQQSEAIGSFQKHVGSTPSK